VIIAPDELVPLGDLLDRRARELPDATALVFADERVTYAELAARADTAARSMVGLGVQRGDTIGILLPSVAAFVALMFGAAKIGAIPVLMNARFKAQELRHVIGNGDLTMVLTSTSVAAAVDFPALLLEAVPDAARAARFVCVLALSDEAGNIVLTARDTVEGRLLRAACGTNGFGYDPLFLIDALGKTTAELEPDEKHAVSHRGNAMRRLKAMLPDVSTSVGTVAVL